MSAISKECELADGLRCKNEGVRRCRELSTIKAHRWQFVEAIVGSNSKSLKEV